MANESRFVVMTVECPRCKAKQKVHVAARTGSARIDQYIFCIDCDTEFKVTVPDKIVGGPFPT